MSSGSIEFRGVTRRFGSVAAVDDLSFTIAAGTFVTLLGPSGCGKTTTLRLLAGLERVTVGQILIGGEDVTLRPAHERDVSMVFQSYALFPHLDVLSNVAYGLESMRIARPEAHRRARETLDMVGLAGFEGRAPSALSGGQQQRVALARALILEPQVLLFDEPLSNLDAGLRRQMRDQIRTLQRRLGLTAVYVTHDRDEALSMSDDVVLMNRGRIEQRGAPRELYTRPRTSFAAAFVSEANLVPVAVRQEGEALVAVLGALSFPFGRDAITHIEAVNRDNLSVAVRAEAVALTAPSDPNAEALKGTVESVAYLGSELEYRVGTPVGPFRVRSRAEFEVGSTVVLELDAASLALVVTGP